MTPTISTTNTISALGAGSGVDVKALAQNLVDVERTPRKAAIDKNIAKSQGAISGISAIKYTLDNLKTAFAALQNQSSFNSIVPRNSQPLALAVTTGSTTPSGSHSVTVTQLARPQRNISDGFASASSELNVTAPAIVGAAFTLQLSVNGGAAQSISVPAGSTTPSGVVAAINAAGKGISAQLINTGSSTKIMLTGTTGANNVFTLTSDDGTNTNTPVANLAFTANLQTAANAELTVNNVPITASTNRVEGAIFGTTLDLYTTTTGSATLDFSRDTSSVKTKLQDVVTAYNEARSMLGVVSDSKSTVPTYGATLVGNALVGSVRNQLREMVLGSSNSAAGGLSALRDLGVSLDRYGVLSLNTSNLDSVLASKFDDVVTLLSNNRENLSSFSTLTAGVAGESVRTLTKLLETTGSLSSQNSTQTARIAAYNKDLLKLEDRMTQLLARYTKQFGAMDALVGQSNSLRASLTSSFDGMMAMYTNK